MLLINDQSEIQYAYRDIAKYTLKPLSLVLYLEEEYTAVHITCWKRGIFYQLNKQDREMMQKGLDL